MELILFLLTCFVGMASLLSLLTSGLLLYYNEGEMYMITDSEFLFIDNDVETCYQKDNLGYLHLEECDTNVLLEKE